MTTLPEVPKPLPPASLKAALIERMRNGATVEEMREVYQFIREIEKDESRLAFDAARPAMQADLPEIPKRGSIDYGKGKSIAYPLWEDTNELIKPVLSRHGFYLDFDVKQQPNSVIVIASLTHELGHAKQVTMGFPIDGSGAKSPVQAIGSTTSYGKRYTAGALLNLTARGEDDDARNGNGNHNATDAFFINQEQIAELERLIEISGRTNQLFCLKFMTKSLDVLPASKYEGAVEFLNKIIKDEGLS